MRRKKVFRLFYFIAVIATSIFILGCIERDGNFTYISGKIECELSWRIDEKAFRARIYREDSENTRVVFYEPSSLFGIEILRKGEQVSVCYEGMSAENKCALESLEIEKFFEYDTKIISSELVEDCNKLTLERACGEQFFLYLKGGECVRIDGELFGKRREINLICFDGDILKENK